MNKEGDCFAINNARILY